MVRSLSIVLLLYQPEVKNICENLVVGYVFWSPEKGELLFYHLFMALSPIHCSVFISFCCHTVCHDWARCQVTGNSVIWQVNWLWLSNYVYLNFFGCGSFACYLFLAGCFLGVLFDPWVGGNMFLQNITELLAYYTTSSQKAVFFIVTTMRISSPVWISFVC